MTRQQRNDRYLDTAISVAKSVLDQNPDSPWLLAGDDVDGFSLTIECSSLADARGRAIRYGKYSEEFPGGVELFYSPGLTLTFTYEVGDESRGEAQGAGQ